MSASSSGRAARLQALQTATTQWAQAQTTYWQNQITLLQNILQGRTGAQGLAQSAAQATSDLVVQQIDDFLG